MLRYWNRLCTLDNSVIAKQIFNCTLHDNNATNTWMANVKQVFQSLSLMSAFRDKRKVNLKNCDIKFRTMTNENWKLNIMLKPKLRTYRLLKDNITTENYLSLPKYQRSLIAKLRSGTLPLAIETGRYTNVPLENRICTLCDNNIIEDEIHFMCVCEKLQDIRYSYFSKYCEKSSVFLSLDTETKFVYIMQNHHGLLGKFLFELWNFRVSLMYNSS